jgi:heme/copper-type cytochrome/quinol oxidase subunit 2
VKRSLLSLTFCGFALAAFLPAETVTLPAVTSLPVGAAASPFFSDVRVFNTSYTTSVSVTAVYRCFLGACPAAAPQVSFALAPRESRAFDDMIFAAFNAPLSGGAVEFTSSGTAVRVTSRLYSTAPIPTVGMFIPGLRASEAHTTAVLTSLANGAFRTNLGLYNGNDFGTVATVRLFNGTALLGVQTVPLAPRSGTQINRIFDVVGQAGVSTTNAYAVVESDGAALFTYAAVIDNATTDPIFVTGAEDQREPAAPVATATPPPPAATPTPTRTPTPTPTRTPTQAPSATVVTLTAQTFRWSFNGGGNTFTMQVGQTYEVRMHTLDITHGFPGIPELGLESVALLPGSAEVVQIVRPTAGEIGTRFFACDIECGSGHGFSGSISVVQ